MSEKVKKIMWAVIDCSITKEQAMATLRIKYAWLYPYITPEVYKQHHDLYLSSNGYDEPEPDVECCDCAKMFSISDCAKIQLEPELWRCFDCCMKKELSDRGMEDEDEEDEDIQKCYNCDEVLDEDMHIFCYRKGDDEMVHCQQCAEDCYEEAKADGWVRDDDNEY